MLNLFQHLNNKFRNKFGMTMYKLSASFKNLKNAKFFLKTTVYFKIYQSSDI